MLETNRDDSEDHLDDKDVIYDITSFGADFLVDGLIRRLADGDIYRPSFQRNFVWTLPQASRFIESMLLGLPIPGIFLYREEKNRKHLIIDGLQRLTTIQAFHDGILPGTDKMFRLKGVKERFEKCSINDLDAADQRRFKDAAIHATIIQQNLPKDDNSAVFHIFERLNSGGTPLQAQEMRAAIYHGPFQEMLERLNEDENWRKIFGKQNKRGKDQELILRFLALKFRGSNYSESMKRFLNEFMEERRDFTKARIKKHETEFRKTCELAVRCLGEKPFRPIRALNVAVFDSCMVALANLKNADAATVKRNYKRLLKDKEYQEATKKSTASESNVKSRIRLATRYLNEG